MFLVILSSENIHISKKAVNKLAKSVGGNNDILGRSVSLEPSWTGYEGNDVGLDLRIKVWCLQRSVVVGFIALGMMYL